MQLSIQTIYGFEVGFSIAESDINEEFNMAWGVTIKLGIVALVFFKENE